MVIIRILYEMSILWMESKLIDVACGLSASQQQHCLPGLLGLILLLFFDQIFFANSLLIGLKLIGHEGDTKEFKHGSFCCF